MSSLPKVALLVKVVVDCDLGCLTPESVLFMVTQQLILLKNLDCSLFFFFKSMMNNLEHKSLVTSISLQFLEMVS